MNKKGEDNERCKFIDIMKSFLMKDLIEPLKQQIESQQLYLDYQKN